MFKVFDSIEYRENNPEERMSFLQSIEKLQKADIVVSVIPISSEYDLEEGSEAREMVENDGISCLPISEYDGVIVDNGTYPSDQILADYLDVPNGILSCNKTSVPASNDMEYSCYACHRR